VADDRVPLSVAVDAERRLWTLRAMGARVGHPVVVGDTVYVPVPGERVAALDVGSGRVRWCSREIPGVRPLYVAVAGAVVAVPILRETRRDAFTALDTTTGKVRWTRRESALWQIAALGDSTFVVWNGMPEERGSIAGIDALSGETLWEGEFERIDGLVVRGERVILGTGRLRALDGRSGDEVWSGGEGELLRRAGEAVEDAAVFLSWRGRPYGPKSLVVGASDTGEQLAETRFPVEAQRYIWGHPELVDGGRVLFHRPAGRRVRLLGYAGLDRAELLESWKLGRLQRGSFMKVLCVGDWMYALCWDRRLYVAEVDPRGGLRRLRLRGPYKTTVREPEYLTAGPGYVLASGSDGMAVLRDGRVLWASHTIRPEVLPVPLDGDRFLFTARSRNDQEIRLYCADVETGRHVLP